MINFSIPLENKKIIIGDLIALLIIYLVPTFSHIFPIPLYLIEPMRIIVILALLNTSKNNSLFLCLLLPIFSYITVGHPLLIKSLLISIELSINILILSLFMDVKKFSLGIFTSILISKIIYYILKFIAIQFSLTNGRLFSTQLEIQSITIIIISIFFIILQKLKSLSDNS